MGAAAPLVHSFGDPQLVGAVCLVVQLFLQYVQPNAVQCVTCLANK